MRAVGAAAGHRPTGGQGHAGRDLVHLDLDVVALAGEEAADAAAADPLGVDDAGSRPVLGADLLEQARQVGALKPQVRGRHSPLQQGRC